MRVYFQNTAMDSDLVKVPMMHYCKHAGTLNKERIMWLIWI